MDKAFDLLEERGRRAVEALRRLQGENADLKKQLGRAAPSPADAQKFDALQKEVQALRKDRDAIRDRIARLVEVLDGLD